MLPLLLALLSDPTAARPETPPAAIEAPAPAQNRCENARLQHADALDRAPVGGHGNASLRRDGPQPVLSDLMHRSGDPLRRYLLIERRIGECAAPVSFDVGGPGDAPRRVGPAER